MKRILIYAASVLVIFSIVAIAQQKVDVAKISAPATGQQTAANSDSVVCSSDMGCGPVTVTNTVNVAISGGDPCGNPANTRTPFNVNFASTTAQVLVPATSSKKGYVCEFTFDTQNSAGDTFMVVDGTQSTNPCDSGTPTALYGSTSVSNGIFANPGVVRGGNGSNELMQTSATNRQICIATVSSTRATASGIYVVQ